MDLNLYSTFQVYHLLAGLYISRYVYALVSFIYSNTSYTHTVFHPRTPTKLAAGSGDQTTSPRPVYFFVGP